MDDSMEDKLGFYWNSLLLPPLHKSTLAAHDACFTAIFPNNETKILRERITQ